MNKENFVIVGWSDKSGFKSFERNELPKIRGYSFERVWIFGEPLSQELSQVILPIISNPIKPAIVHYENGSFLVGSKSPGSDEPIKSYNSEK